MPRAGERYEHKGIILEIVEVMPYRLLTGRRAFLIAYRIIDGSFISPVAHFYYLHGMKMKDIVVKVMENYLQVKNTLLRGVR